MVKGGGLGVKVQFLGRAPHSFPADGDAASSVPEPKGHTSVPIMAITWEAPLCSGHMQSPEF